MTLWVFACRVYANADVASTCLKAQDQHGREVCLLLWAAWQALMHSQTLTKDHIAKAEAQLAPWSDNVIKALRAARRQIVPLAGHGQSRKAEAIRRRILSVELAVERMALESLSRIRPTRQRAGSVKSQDPVSDRLAERLAFNLSLVYPEGATELAASILIAIQSQQLATRR